MRFMSQEKTHENPLEYGFYATMEETLQLVLKHVDEARHADDDLKLFVHLKMASRAMRCALELLSDWSAQQVRNEEKT